MKFWFWSTLLGLFGTMVLPAMTQAQTIEIEVNDTPIESDDYLGWTPTRGRIRQVSASVDLTVVLESTKRIPSLKNGEVSFASFTPNAPTPSAFNPLPTLSTLLPADGTWKRFWVAGKEISSDGKDVKILVKDSSGTILKELAVMVRVRKNAESLSDIERGRFLDALAKVHDLNNPQGVGKNSKYLKYVKAHAEAFSFGIHGTPAFTQWHRAMILSFERELQTFDPRVALPYWEFHSASPKLFSRKFGGVVTSSNLQVQFDLDNPIQKWAMPSLAAIESMPDLTSIPISDEKMVRAQNASTTIPFVDLDSVMAEGDHLSMRYYLENNYHNDAHQYLGGWLVTAQSPRDPIFFLLHANVDRAWAKWQREKNRFDPNGTDPLTYSPVGNYPGPAVANRSRAGIYSKDTVWPWNLQGGTQGTADSLDDWPNYSFPMPLPFANHGPDGRVHNLIDYLNTHGTGKPHGVSYDDVPFK
ncbi:MAG: tyrosinase family protein [Pirellula sp.]